MATTPLGEMMWLCADSRNLIDTGRTYHTKPSGEFLITGSREVVRVPYDLLIINLLI